MISGQTAEGFGPVADSFAANFADGRELGAAVAVFLHGRPVVDLWAGTADRRTGRPWAEDTSAVVFSCTKGLMTVCAYGLVEDGRLNLDAPVATYWPEFAAHGKSAITVRSVLSHRAGLPVIDRQLSRAEALAWDPVVAALEDQAPLWEPGTAHMYHAKTFGWLVGEIVRRITGMTPGTYFRTTIAEPLGARTRIGMPLTDQLDIARTEPPPIHRRGEPAAPEPSESEVRAVTLNGALPFPDLDGEVVYNDPAVRAAELPGSNAISSARDLARIYAACIGTADGIRLIGTDSLADATREQSSGPQRHGPQDSPFRWGTGFMLESTSRPMAGPGSFGHDGAGGQLAFAHAGLGVAFAYVNNQMGGPDDDRANRLSAAMRACLHV